MSTYTRTSPNISFLNDKNIASSLTDNSVLSNSIPSFESVSAAYYEFTEFRSISTTVNNEFVHLSGDTITGNLSVTQQLSVANDVTFDKNVVIKGDKLINGKNSKVDASERGIAFGVRANASHNDSFVWNGDRDHDYSAQGTTDGTFNINPENGTKDFYIGTRNLSSIISNDVNMSVEYLTGYVDSISTSLSSGLSSYSETLCSQICNYIDDAHFAKRDEFSVIYNPSTYYLSVTLKDNKGNTTTKAVDATKFVTGRTVKDISLNAADKLVSIYLKNADDTSSTESLDIPLKELADMFRTDGTISVSQELVFSVKDYTVLTGCLNTTSANVVTLSNTTIPGIRTDVNTVNDKVNYLSNTTIPGIANNVSYLSNTTIPGIVNDVNYLNNTTIPVITGNVHTLQINVSQLSNNTIPVITGNVSQLSNVIIPAINNNVNTLSNTTIPGIANNVSYLSNTIIQLFLVQLTM